MNDSEIIKRLIERDNTVTQEFFYVKCRPLFYSIINLIFSYPVDYDEFVNELYDELMSNDARKLKQFEFKSTLQQWLKVVAIRFFIRKRDNMIENTSKESLYYETNDCPCDNESRITAKTDLEHLFSNMKNQRYVYVIRKLIIENVEPEFLARSMGITTANLYNIKRRAMVSLSHIAIKDKEIYVRR